MLNGQRHGRGTQKLAGADGSSVTYIGGWFRGKRHGEGKITYDESGQTYYEACHYSFPAFLLLP